jgi:Ca2+-binding RTX toxin-like protein
MHQSALDALEPRLQFAVTAVFLPIAGGSLNVFGDGLDNVIDVSRDAAGAIRVNGGAVPIQGGTATVGNTSVIQIFGLNGNDTLRLNEVNGALPKANIFGGSGNDTIIGGSGADQLFGQAGNDDLQGKGGNDLLFGGADNDVLTGGDADDQAFGEAGNDRMIWNPGDDTDLNEGGDGIDTVEVNGGNGAESFTVTANGTRVRFDRTVPAPFSIDIGTSENLVLNAAGGDDSFSASGNLATLIKITADGGTGNDTLLGGNGNDTLLGGDGNDFIDGNQGADVANMGAGDDVFQWDPGDGSDVVEGQDGTDRMLFNGSNQAEKFDASANGQRVRFTRDLGNIVMDLNDMEAIDLNALAGTDTLTVNDMAGTDLVEINANLAGATTSKSGDGEADSVIVNATNGNDAVAVAGADGSATVTGIGISATVNLTAAEPAKDTLTINALAGDDAVSAEGLAANSVKLVENGGDGNDVLVGSAGNDTLRGEAGDDVLIGGGGQDVLDGGTGNNVILQSTIGTTDMPAWAQDRLSMAAKLLAGVSFG